MIKNNKITYKGYELKSNLEYMFFLYLEELEDAGYIEEFSYETTTFRLSESINLPYLKQQKTKIKEESEFIMRECTYTPDFTIRWLKKAKNVFYLDRDEPISCNKDEIPFRLASDGVTSYIEVKPMNESKLDSSKEFPSMQKWVYQNYGMFVQKIKPYDSYGKDCLFQQTFVPKKVIVSEVYVNNCKYGLKGQSKIKFKIRTLEEYEKITPN